MKIITLLILINCGLYSDSLKILFLGDTYFGESYQLNSSYNDGVNYIDEHGYDYFFENVKEMLYNSDYTIANFEAPLCENKDIKSFKPYVHWSEAANTLTYLKKYSIDAVSLGNNHAMDIGEDGLKESFVNFSSAGIKYFGAGLNDSSAAEPFFVNNAMGFEVVLISGFEYRASYDTIYNFYASNNKAGVNMLVVSNLIESVRKIKEIYPNSFIIFFPHWGKNYKPVMNYQIEMAHKLIDAGVDLIIGQGAHTVQQTERYNDKWILYNIGNFIFNAPGRYKSTGAKPYSIITELLFADNKNYIRLYPIYVNNLETDYQVRYLDEDEFEDFCKSINITESYKLLEETGVKFLQLNL